MAMVANLKTVFKSLVDNATWMDSTTAAIAKEKVDYIIDNIGYPDWIQNKTALENYYSPVKVKIKFIKYYIKQYKI